MPYQYTIRSKSLSKSKIIDTIRKIPSSRWKALLEEYWEFIPDGDFTDEEKLEFVVASVPKAGSCSANELSRIVMGGMLFVNPKEYQGAKPNLYRALDAARPDITRRMAELFRPHKHVPDKLLQNQMWVCLMSLTSLIDNLALQRSDKMQILDEANLDEVVELCEWWLSTQS